MSECSSADPSDESFELIGTGRPPTSGGTIVPAANIMPAGASSPATVMGAAAEKLTVENVLDNVIECYLFGDLDSMKAEITLKQCGSIAYPMMMAVLSGSEMLGALTSDAKKANRIATYWAQVHGPYRPALRRTGRDRGPGVSHGIAHNYLSWLGVGVVRGQPHRHLRREQAGVMVRLSRAIRRLPPLV
jgi:hypothetical protein